MRTHVAFTRADQAGAGVGILVDVLGASSTIAYAVASGYRRVLCCAENEQARVLGASLPASAVDGDPRDAAKAAEPMAPLRTAYEDPTARTSGPAGLDENIALCADEDVLDVVPRLSCMLGAAAEIEG